MGCVSGKQFQSNCLRSGNNIAISCFATTYNNILYQDLVECHENSEDFVTLAHNFSKVDTFSPCSDQVTATRHDKSLPIESLPIKS